MSDFIPPAKPLIGDEESAAVERVMRSGMIAQGPEVAAFERDFAEHFGLGRDCVAVIPGSGLHLGLLAAGVERGTRSSSRRLPSARPPTPWPSPAPRRSSPTSSRRFCLDPGAVEAACDRETGGSCRCTLRAPGGNDPPPGGRGPLGSWDLRGCSAGPRRRMAGQPVGTFGAFGLFTLYPTKNMTSGEGGMVSRRRGIERKVRLYVIRAWNGGTKTKWSGSTRG